RSESIAAGDAAGAASAAVAASAPAAQRAIRRGAGLRMRGLLRGRLSKMLFVLAAQESYQRPCSPGRFIRPVPEADRPPGRRRRWVGRTAVEARGLLRTGCRRSGPGREARGAAPF